MSASNWKASPFELNGATALITGGAKRLGRALSLALAEAGANVIVHCCSSLVEAKKTCEDARRLGVQAKWVQADFREQRDWKAFIGACRAWQGRLDILINNASVYPTDGLATFAPQDFRTNMELHALTPVLLARAFAEGAIRGRILNLLDTRITAHDKQHFSYHLSKRTLSDMTKLLALEYAPAITVNALAPGPILPPPGEEEAYLRRAARFVPLQRAGTLTEITDAALALLRSDFITGQTLFVDGGRHLMGGPYGAG